MWQQYWLKGDQYLKAQILHNFHKGCWWTHLNSLSSIAQQIVKCLTCNEKHKFFSIICIKIFILFFQVEEKNQVTPNAPLMITYNKILKFERLLNW
jgi:hypothetical protein